LSINKIEKITQIFIKNIFYSGLYKRGHMVSETASEEEFDDEEELEDEE